VVGVARPIARELARNGSCSMTIAVRTAGTPTMFGLPQAVQTVQILCRQSTRLRLAGRPDDDSVASEGDSEGGVDLQCRHAGSVVPGARSIGKFPAPGQPAFPKTRWRSGWA